MPAGIWARDSEPGDWQAESGDQIAGGRGGGDRALELSADFVGAKGRAGAGGGLPNNFEACESDAALQSLRTAECCDAAKLPKGVLQVICGSAAMIGEEFLNNPIVKKITFTGSTEVGQKLIVGAAKDVKKLSLELGGIRRCWCSMMRTWIASGEGTLMAKFRNSGQSCIAANRIYVQAGIYEKFAKTFAAKTQALKVGDGLEGEQDVGPVINEKGLKFVLDQIEDAKKRGAKVLAGGKRMDRPGYFLEATVPSEVACGGFAYERGETFAPMAPLAKFTTEAEGIELANSSPFGLSAYVFTSEHRSDVSGHREGGCRDDRGERRCAYDFECAVWRCEAFGLGTGIGERRIGFVSGDEACFDWDC